MSTTSFRGARRLQQRRARRAFEGHGGYGEEGPGHGGRLGMARVCPLVGPTKGIGAQVLQRGIAGVACVGCRVDPVSCMRNDVIFCSISPQ